MASIWPPCQPKSRKGLPPRTQHVDSSYHFALEGPPDDGSVADRELGQTAPGKNAPFGHVEGVHDGDDVVVSRAGALNILDQLCRDELVHVSPKVRGMQRDTPLEVV